MRILSTIIQAIILGALLYGIVFLLFVLSESPTSSITKEMSEQTRNLVEWRNSRIERASQ